MATTIGLNLQSSDLNNLLAKVLSVQESHKRIWCRRYTLGLIDLVVDLSVQQQLLDVSEEVFKVLCIEVCDDKAADCQGLGNDVHQVLDTVGWAIVLRDHTTGNDPSMFVEHIQRRLQGLATDILKVDVDTLGCQLSQGLASTLFLVVERVIKTDLLEKIVDLFITSSAADDGQAPRFGQLTSELA